MDNERVRRLTRAWLMQRHAQPAPLPSLEQIRRAVGWCDDTTLQTDAAGPSAVQVCSGTTVVQAD